MTRKNNSKQGRKRKVVRFMKGREAEKKKGKKTW